MKLFLLVLVAAFLIAAPAQACQSVQVQYAHTTDKASRLDEIGAQLTEVVGNAQRWFGRETSGRLTISYQLPIKEIVLSSADSYQVSGGLWMPKIHDDLRGPCHTLTFVDGMQPGPAGQAEAVWEGYSQTNPALSPFATQPLSAIVWLGARPLNDQTIPELYPRTVAHETLHVLGAVAPFSPNGDGFAHCLDGKDLMCPQDGPCPATDNIGRLDCGRDDYFNESPAPGSYLATHWNVANSPYLKACSCGAPPAPPETTSYLTKRSYLRGSRVLITRAYRPDKSSTITFSITPRKKARLCVNGVCSKSKSIDLPSSAAADAWIKRANRSSKHVYLEAR